jgi:hypothetical protein
MKTSPAENLRRCLGALVDDDGRRAEEVPRALRRFARAALAGTPYAQDRAAVDELVSEFLLSLVVRGRGRGGLRPIAQEMLAWPDRQLVGTVRHRFRHLAAEHGPHWTLLKSLREHVGNALDAGLPPAPEAAPVGLEAGGRLSGRLIALACAHLLASGKVARTDAKALAAQLLADYRPPVESLAAATERETPDAHAEALERAGARELAEAYLREEGAASARLLVRRAAGMGLQHLAMFEGVALSTVHGRLRRAMAAFAICAQRLSACSRTSGLALDALGELNGRA